MGFATVRASTRVLKRTTRRLVHGLRPVSDTRAVAVGAQGRGADTCEPEPEHWDSWWEDFYASENRGALFDAWIDERSFRTIRLKLV